MLLDGHGIAWPQRAVRLKGGTDEAGENHRDDRTGKRRP